MANPEHLEIIMQGVEAWNKWRFDNRFDVRQPDLSEFTLCKANLSGANLSDVLLSGSDLSGANLSGANLSHADLSNTSFWQANLSGASLSRANLSEARLFQANLNEADLSHARLMGADLGVANLIRANLREAKMSNVGYHSADTNLSQAKLDEANLYRARLEKVNLTKANLLAANLQEAQLWEANLSEARLVEADLTKANLSGANLWEADMSRANLSYTSLQRTIFNKTNLNGANFSQAKVGNTIFANVDLSQVKEIVTLNHKQPSVVDINTIYQSKDRIPKVFLEQAGVHPDIIRWQHSLHTLPTVFVCYSHKDETENEQLLTHLGVLRELSLIDIWDDTRILGGSEWKLEITNAIARASVAILLVSANFLTSQTIKELEITEMLKRRENDQKFVIYPIIAKPCAWNSFPWLSKLQVRPNGGEPIWVKGKDIDVDMELTKIANEVTDIIKSLWLNNR
ncbi:MAG: toll/interleukin-1 receptor domain-containing protein [Anaerolineae bacterium]|nr:toll/interleukin-1 receptor domain-containing protein [Anaerolineae bacterium]